MAQLIKECSIALRALRKSPVFTSVSVVSLAVGMAACVISFSLLYSANLKPFPYPHAESIVELFEYLDVTCAPSCTDFGSKAAVNTWKLNLRAVTDIGAISGSTFQIETAPNESAELAALKIEPKVFATLGVHPEVGRLFLTGCEAEERSVLISHNIWKSMFAQRGDIVGRTVRSTDGTFSVIGVLPPEMSLPSTADVWLCLRDDALSPDESYYVIGRLRSGVTQEGANQELAQLFSQRQSDSRGDPNVRLSTVLTLRQLRRQDTSSLYVVIGALAGMFLMACTNAASLFAVRRVSRAPIAAIKAALGASSWAIRKQPLLEALSIGCAAAVIGIGAAFCLRSLILGILQSYYKSPLALDITPVIVIVALSIGLFVSALLGLVAGYDIVRADTLRFLSSGRSGRGTKRQSNLRKSLVALQIAGAILLVSASALLVTTYKKITSMPLGFDAKGLIYSGMRLQKGSLQEQANRSSITESLLDRIPTLPGAIAAAGWGVRFHRRPGKLARDLVSVEGLELNQGLESVPMASYYVSERFFSTLRIPIVKGRTFDDTEIRLGTPVAIINAELAHRWWPNQNPIGRRFKLEPSSSDSTWLTVIGMVPNTVFLDFSGTFGDLVNPGHFPFVFRPLGNRGPARLAVAIRTRGPTSETIRGLRHLIGTLDHASDLTVDGIDDFSEALTRYGPLSLVALNTLVVTGIAIVGAILAIIGVYGIVAEGVAIRTAEIAIRSALGAQPSSIVHFLLRDLTRMWLVGAGLGIALSVLFLRGLGTLLYGVSPYHPLFLLGILFGSFVAVGFSGLIATRKALSIHPMSALKLE